MKAADIIKYEGDNSTFIWKHPCEDFNTLTQLIVHESQEAIFFMNGQALDLFGAGRHTLETQNIPKIGKLLNQVTDGETPFHCEVYFINKTVQMAIKWGTDSKIRFIEPTMGIPLEIGVCGEMNLSVADSRLLLLKLVGTMKGIAWGDNGVGFTKSIQNSFRPLISTAVKTHFPQVIKSQNIDILEIDENLGQLSKVLHESIAPGFEEYGLTIPQFYVSNVALPENDPNFRRLRDLHTVSFQTKVIQAEKLIKTAHAEAEASVAAAQRQAEMERQTTETEITKQTAERDLIRAQVKVQESKMAGLAEAEVMAAKGYTQKDVLQADVQKAYADSLGKMKIGGSGGSTGSGNTGNLVGLGVDLATMGIVVPQIGGMLKEMSTSLGNAQPQANVPAAKCAKCGSVFPEHANFCSVCGERVASAASVACPACGKAVPKGKFCPLCGHKLVADCPKCGAENADDASFCSKCGEKL